MKGGGNLDRGEGGVYGTLRHTLFSVRGGFRTARCKKHHDCATMMHVRARVSPASEPPLLPESIPFYQGIPRTGFYSMRVLLPRDRRGGAGHRQGSGRAPRARAFFSSTRVYTQPHTHTHTHRTSMIGGGRRSACLLPSRLLHQYWKGAESHSECPRNLGLSLLAHPPPPPPASFLPPPPSSAANTALIAPASLGPSFLDPHCTDATSSRVAETSLDTVPKR